MRKYNVKVQVNFEGVIEANNEKEAEQLAWDSWGPTYDDPITYDCIESINVDELAHCDDCSECMEEPYNECECEEEEETNG